MGANHVEQHAVEHGHLEHEIEPGHVDEEAHEEGNHTGVKREHVGVFHQRKATQAEGLAEIRWCLPVVLRADALHHRLEAGCPCLLSLRIVDVEHLEKLVDEILLPTHLLEVLFQLRRVRELAARLPFEEKQVDVALIVGHCCLFAVKPTGHGG